MEPKELKAEVAVQAAPEAVRFVRRAQELGFTRVEIEAVIALRDDDNQSGSEMKKRVRSTLVNSCCFDASMHHCPILMGNYNRSDPSNDMPTPAIALASLQSRDRAVALLAVASRVRITTGGYFELIALVGTYPTKEQAARWEHWLKRQRTPRVCARVCRLW